MYKQVLIPDNANHTIEIPEEFYGKTVEVIIMNVDEVSSNGKPVPPVGKKVDVNQLFKSFGEAPDFPSTEEIRKKHIPIKANR